MALLNLTLKTNCNRILSNLQTNLLDSQKDYKNTVLSTDAFGNQIKRNKYAQCILTPASIPEDGIKSAPNKTVKPTDQAENWNDVGVTLPVTMDCSVAVDVYKNSQGWGYVIRGETISGGKKYIKVIHVTGNETWREQDWTEVKIDE